VAAPTRTKITTTTATQTMITKRLISLVDAFRPPNSSFRQIPIRTARASKADCVDFAAPHSTYL
jgi:hypothetical protein